MLKTCLITCAMLASVLLVAEDPALTLKLTPGYEACSIEIDQCKATEIDAFQSEVSFRIEGASEWLPALPLAYDAKFKVARGSLMNLKENTSYQLRVAVTDSSKKEVLEQSFKTLSSQVQIAKTIEIGPETKLPLAIKESGTANGYIRYTAKPGFVLDGGEEMSDVIRLVKVEYIILDGLTIRGGRINGIRMANASHIQILNCDIAGFSRIGIHRPDLDGKFYEEGKAKPLNNDAGIRINDCDDVLVERCYIHDPRATANSWFYSHPAGPNAILVGGTSQAVFRYNDFIGSDLHRWNDAVEGIGNGSERGSVYRDAEITGNYFAFGSDDGMELDGGQQNCRFMYNKTEGMLCGVSTAPCLIGPSYVVGNLFCSPGDTVGYTNTAVKNNFSVAGRGKIHFLHNTMVGNWSTFSEYGNNKDGLDELKSIFKGYSRNNLAMVTGSMSVNGIYRARNDFDYDLIYTTGVDPISILQKQYRQEMHGLTEKPIFVNADRGLYALAQGSPGIGAGEPVPNVSSGGKAPSMGMLHADIPYRPIPFHTDAARIDFASLSAQPQTVTVVVDDPKFKSSFRILHNDTTRFIKVEPESGTLAYGKPVKLTVSIDPAEITSARINAGAFLIRLPNGFSRAVSVYANSIEDKERLARDRANAVQAKLSSTENQKSVFDAEVRDEGTYFLFLRTDFGRCRVKVSIDGGEELSLIMRDGTAGERWRALGKGWLGSLPINLTPGKHTITVEGNANGKVLALALAKTPEELLLAPNQP